MRAFYPRCSFKGSLEKCKSAGFRNLISTIVATPKSGKTEGNAETAHKQHLQMFTVTQNRYVV